MKIFGRELWADVELDRDRLRDTELVRASLRAGARAMGCAVLSEHHQEFEPEGVTAVVVIGESHLLASTYAELGILAVGMQSCAEHMELLDGLAAIGTHLGARRIRSLGLMRRLDVPMQVVLQLENVPLRAGQLELAAAKEVRPSYGFSTSAAIK